MIRLSPLVLGDEEEALVLEVLRSGRLAQGPFVERLEEGFRTLTGARHAVAVSSGTAAVVLAVEALRMGPGDEVITSPFTFAASINAILEAGASVRFADITPDDFTIDPQAIEHTITPRTTAIMPVHLYGQPADLPAIAEIAERRGLAIIEDAAQAPGASVEGRSVGTYGIGCFSFYATKNLTTGEGGMVTTDDPQVARLARLLRNQGMEDRYAYEVPGHNFRMTEMQAAVGLPQLAQLPHRNEMRRSNAAALSKHLQGLPGVTVPVEVAGRYHVWHQYTIRVPSDRDALAARLADRGIETGVYYPRAAYDYDCYRDHPRVVIEAMPEAERAAREVLSLPVHPHLTTEDVQRIADAVRSAMESGDVPA